MAHRAVAASYADPRYIINECETVARRTFADQRIKAMRSPSGTQPIDPAGRIAPRIGVAYKLDDRSRYHCPKA
ncbi:hypothetical protein MCEREM21A_02503 [Sphingomonadaceae bacterium]